MTNNPISRKLIFILSKMEFQKVRNFTAFYVCTIAVSMLVSATDAAVLLRYNSRNTAREIRVLPPSECTTGWFPYGAIFGNCAREHIRECVVQTKPCQLSNRHAPNCSGSSTFGFYCTAPLYYSSSSRRSLPNSIVSLFKFHA